MYYPSEGHRDYRLSVIATWKALAWISALETFIAMVLVGWTTGAGVWVAGWIDVRFLSNDRLQTYFLAPLLWAAIAGAIAIVLYSTVIKWTWDVWDRRAKFRSDVEPPDSTENKPTIKPPPDETSKPERG